MSCEEGKTAHSCTGHIQEMSEQIERLNTLMASLSDKRFFGEVVVKFEAGKITVVRKTESIIL